MSMVMFFIRRDGKTRKAYAAEQFNMVDGKFTVLMNTNGYWSGLVPIDVSFDDIVSLNTEAVWWLEEHGVAIPEGAPVRATGYGADIKQKSWEERRGK